MDRNTYLQNPCRASSLPFWKTNSIQIPDDLIILREDDSRLETTCLMYKDTPYFKLLHSRTGVEKPTLPKGYHFVSPDETTLSSHISICYGEIGVSSAELADYHHHPTYVPDLWLAIVDEDTNKTVASGIAEVDTEIREGILEWIQVTPVCRRRGWGSLLVRELLYRMKGLADFVTVSGREGNPSNPRALYESCGFGYGVIWHVFDKRKQI